MQAANRRNLTGVTSSVIKEVLMMINDHDGQYRSFEMRGRSHVIFNIDPYIYYSIAGPVNTIEKHAMDEHNKPGS